MKFITQYKFSHKIESYVSDKITTAQIHFDYHCRSQNLSFNSIRSLRSIFCVQLKDL